MTDLRPAMDPPGDDLAERIVRFLGSGVFDRMYHDGMRLVEETAAYLDGPGRAASRTLPRAAALAYAGESMRLTTRLMQIASWLMVQRALRDGEITPVETREEKYRLSTRPDVAAFAEPGDLPEPLADLIARAEALYGRVRRLDEALYEGGQAAAGDAISQLSRLRRALDPL